MSVQRLPPIVEQNTAASRYLSKPGKLYDNDRIGLLKNVINAISTVIKRSLSPPEVSIIEQSINKMDQRSVRGREQNNIERFFVNRYLVRLNDIRCNREVIDNHEVQKDIIGARTDSDPIAVGAAAQEVQRTTTFDSGVDLAAVRGNSSVYSFHSLFAPTALERKSLLLFDTRFRSLETDGTTRIRWNLTNSTNTTQGSVNSATEIRDIIRVRLSSFKMPYNASADIGIGDISVNVREWADQAVIAHQNTRFHFLCDVKKEDRWIIAEPKNNGEYTFNNPIRTTSNITLTFGNPFETIVLRPDRSEMSFSYGLKTTCTTTINHDLDNSDRVIISGFTTDNIAADASTINIMNRSSGHEITKIDNNSFTINVNTSNITPLSNHKASCYFNPRRMYLYMEVTYLQQE